MPGDHRDTANHNIDLLLSAGFKRQGNTSIFCKGGSCILSPQSQVEKKDITGST